MNRYLVVAGRFNDLITKALLEGARERFADAGLTAAQVDVLWVPGSFEIPVVAARGAKSGVYLAIVCLGAVIRGDTPHFDYVAGQAASGLMQVSIETGVPVIFGILTTDTIEQALSRCGIKGGNKGRDAADAALAMTKAVTQLREWERR